MPLLQISNNSIGKKTSIARIAGLAAFLLFAFVAPAHALTLSPARIEIKGDPGASVGGEFTLINEQSVSETLYASYENFSAQGETGAPSFSAEKTDLDTWMSVTPSQITLAPGQVATVPYVIAIPKDASPGGYFAAIFWSSTPPSTTTTQVSIGAKVGLLILLRVNGAVSESAGITQFTRNGHGFFYETLPVAMTYKFRNNGGDRLEPVGTVSIRDTFFIPADHIDANPMQGNILPGSVRSFSVRWLKQAEPLPVQGFLANASYQWRNFAVGLYSANLDLAYGTQGLHAKKTLWFFVFPWQLLVCLALIIGIGGWILRAGLVRYNRYIVRKAQAGMRHHDADSA